MPHLELLGIRSLEEFGTRFRPLTLEEEGRVLKIGNYYVAYDRKSALMECIAVEGFLRQTFFVLLSLRQDGVLIRLLPRTAPEKTVGVKRCLIWVGHLLAGGRPEARVGATNLEAELGIPFPKEIDRL
jgi:hypothetical protein